MTLALLRVGLVTGLILLAVPHAVHLASPRLCNSVRFYRGESLDSWGATWQVHSAAGRRTVIYSTGADRADDHHFSPWLGSSAMPPASPLVDDVRVMSPDDLRLLLWMVAVFALRCLAGLGIALGVFGVPDRFARRWWFGGGLACLLSVVFLDAVTLAIATTILPSAVGYHLLPDSVVMKASVVGSSVLFAIFVVARAQGDERNGADPPDPVIAH